MTDYTWRAAGANDPTAKVLEQTCLAATCRYAIPLFETAARGAITAWGLAAEYDGETVAFAWLAEEAPNLHLWLYAQNTEIAVPHILDWAAQKAVERKSSAIHIRSEANTPELDALYQAAGYECRLQETIMVYGLKNPLPDISLPPGFERAAWSVTSALQFYAAYTAAFRQRPGFQPREFEDWFEYVSEDDDFRPDLSAVALDEGLGAGYVLCNVPLEPNLWGERGGWISQVGTHPDWQGRGIASALMVDAMQRMKAENLDYAILHVNVNNPKAQRVYEKLGFAIVGQRARYLRNLL